MGWVKGKRERGPERRAGGRAKVSKAAEQRRVGGRAKVSMAAGQRGAGRLGERGLRQRINFIAFCRTYAKAEHVY